MSPETSVGPAAGDIFADEESGGADETVKRGDGGSGESDGVEGLLMLGTNASLRERTSCGSAAGDSVMGEIMTVGGGETALSTSSSTGRTDLPNEDARGVFSSRISSSAFNLSGGSLDRPSCAGSESRAQALTY